jgi:dienelactone hydrolase
VLVHESGGGPEQFEDFVPYLHERGFAALTYGSRPLPDRMDETRNAQDIAGAVRALRRREGIDPDRIAVLGASIGATSAAYHSFSASGEVRATVGLSPGTFLDEEPPDGEPRDVLLIADEAEQASAEFLAADSPGITAQVAPLDGHGVALLEDARVRADVLEWLAARLEG